MSCRGAALVVLVVASVAGASSAGEHAHSARWSRENAWQWYIRQPWLCGFNYVPSTACNTTEWWQAETFDPETIDRELGWAAAAGFNTTRAFLQYLVWHADPEGFKKRVSVFLTLAARHGIRVMPVLFDDCSFGDPLQTEPYLGKQREPIPGMILPSWTPSPGLRRVTDRAAWPDLERYVKDVVGHFGRDGRVVIWDLYNEPGNTRMGDKSRPLVEAAFAWARAAGPSQPLTVSAWNRGLGRLNKLLLEESDITSFHAYTDHAGMAAQIDRYEKHLRPVVCTEWMARAAGARFDTELPLFKQRGVGCYCWGLVNGRTQAQFPWWNKRGGKVDPKTGWFHDIFHRDGKPYRPEEIKAIRWFTRHKEIDWAVCYRPAPRPPERMPGHINDTDEAVRYSGKWTLWEGDGPRDGSLHHARNAGCSVEVTFEGTGVELWHKAGPDCGIADIFLDGKPAPVARIDTYAPAADWNVCVRLAHDLPRGRHTLKIAVTGRKRKASTNSYIQIAGFNIR